MNILRIDGSARISGSITRQLADDLISQLRARNPQATVTQRELSDHLPLLDEQWVDANFTDPSERSDEQRAALSLSDALVAELKAADVIVIGVPVYNFGVPAAVKAWVDLVCRARKTFRYTENGPVGMLEDRPVYLVVASGGIEIGGDMDFATGYMRHLLGFIGIRDVRLIAAGQSTASEDEALGSAREQIDVVLAEAA